MPVEIRIQLNEGGLARLLSSPAGEVAGAVRDVTEDVARTARSFAPVDSGRLRGSIRTRMDYGTREIRGTVYTRLEYGIYVHEGTGIYGPSGRPIQPRRGQYLVFTPRGSDGPVFATEVRGQRPQRYLLRALQTVSPWIVNDRVRYF